MRSDLMLQADIRIDKSFEMGSARKKQQKVINFEQRSFFVSSTSRKAIFPRSAFREPARLFFGVAHQGSGWRAHGAETAGESTRALCHGPRGSN